MHKGRIPNFRPRRFIPCQEQIAEDVEDFGLARLFGNYESAASIITSANEDVHIVNAGDMLRAVVPSNNGDAGVTDALGSFGVAEAFGNIEANDNSEATKDVEVIGGMEDIGNTVPVTDIEATCSNEDSSVDEDKSSGSLEDIDPMESSDSIGCIACLRGTDGNVEFSDVETIGSACELSCTDFESNSISIGSSIDYWDNSDDQSFNIMGDINDFESIYSLNEFDYIGAPIGIETSSDLEYISGIEAISDVAYGDPGAVDDLVSFEDAGPYGDPGAFGYAEAYAHLGANYNPRTIAELAGLGGIRAIHNIREVAGMGGVSAARPYDELDPIGGAGAAFDMEAIGDIAALRNERHVENLGYGNYIGFGQYNEGAEGTDFGASIDLMAGGDIGALIDLGAGGDFIPAIPMEMPALNQNVHDYYINVAHAIWAPGDFAATVDIGGAGDATIAMGINVNQVQPQIFPAMQLWMNYAMQPRMNAAMLPWMNAAMHPWINPLMQPWMNVIIPPQMHLGMLPIMQPHMYHIIHHHHPQIMTIMLQGALHGLLPMLMPVMQPEIQLPFVVDIEVDGFQQEQEEIEEAEDLEPNRTSHRTTRS